MYEVFGVLVIILPTLISNHHFEDLCDAGKGMASIGLGFCYLFGVALIKRIWED